MASTAFFEMHSNKKDQDLKVDYLMTLEGGAADNVPPIGGAFGIGYYPQNDARSKPDDAYQGLRSNYGQQ